MILPTKLSVDALAVLRLFIAAGGKSAGSSLSLAEMERGRRRPELEIEAGVAELAAAGLVRRAEGSEPAAVLTTDGERFFARYHWSCHARSSSC